MPALLVVIAVIDGTLAGYRAATGRSGLIRKRLFYRRAMLRGLTVSAAALGGLAVLLGVVLAWSGARYADLVDAGTAMLWFIGPFAAIVIASLAGYAVLPRRAATFLILLGLGPLTLLRPAVVLAACAAAAWTVPALPVVACALAAAAAVLAVEPVVHRRWYRRPV